MNPHRVSAVALCLLVLLPAGARTQAPAAAPQSEFVSQEFCDYFIRLGEAAQRNYREMKGAPANGDAEFRVSTLQLPGARCVISEESSLFMCTWENRPVFALRRDFDVMTKSVQACFPAYKAEEFEIEEAKKKWFDLSLPQGAKGGPTRISIRLDPKSIWMGVASEKEQR
jgi:hypothetical protein